MATDPRSSIFGVPIAVFGVAFYVTQLVISGVPCRSATWWTAASRALGLAGCVTSTGLLVYMRLYMPYACLLCVTSAALVAGTSLLATFDPEPVLRPSARWGLGVVSASALLSVYGALYRPHRLDVPVDWDKLASIPGSVLAPTELSVGTRNSGNLIIVFTDLECSVCQEATPRLYAAALRSGSAQIVIRHFPLPSHPSAYAAAVAFEAFRARGLAAEYLELLFRAKPKTGKQFAAIHMELSRNTLPLRTDEVAKAVDRVEADVRLARRINLIGTPFLVLIRQGRVEPVSEQAALRILLPPGEATF